MGPEVAPDSSGRSASAARAFDAEVDVIVVVVAHPGLGLGVRQVLDLRPGLGRPQLASQWWIEHYLLQVDITPLGRGL